MGCGTLSKELELYYSCKAGDVEVAIELLRQGIDPNFHNSGERYFTPLHWACVNGSVSLCEMLLRHGADYSCVTRDGYQPMHYAAEGGFLDICMLLYSKGAKHSPADNEGNTPLHLAAKMGRMCVVSYLLTCGADIHVKNKHGTSVVSIAHPYRCASVLTKVCEGKSFLDSLKEVESVPVGGIPSPAKKRTKARRKSSLQVLLALPESDPIDPNTVYCPRKGLLSATSSQSLQKGFSAECNVINATSLESMKSCESECRRNSSTLASLDSIKLGTADLKWALYDDGPGKGSANRLPVVSID